MDSFGALYSDGQSAKITPVQISITATSLTIKNQDGEKITEWPLDQLTSPAPVKIGRHVTLGCDQFAAARLQVEDLNFAPALLKASPLMAKIHRRDPTNASGISKTSLSLLAIPVFLFIFLIYTLGNAAPNLISDEWAANLGQGVIKSLFEDSAQPCDAAEAEKIFTDLTYQMINSEKAIYKGAQPHIQIIHHPMINAFTAPGAQIAITTGFINWAETPEDLTFVLAHELGHASNKDGLRNAIHSQGFSILMRALTGSSIGGDIISSGILLAHSRDVELTADLYGLELLKAAGIRTDNLTGIFKRLEGDEFRFWGDELLMDHPDHTARDQLIAQHSQTGKDALPRAQWQKIKAVCKTNG